MMIDFLDQNLLYRKKRVQEHRDMRTKLFFLVSLIGFLSLSAFAKDYGFKKGDKILFYSYGNVLSCEISNESEFNTFHDYYDIWAGYLSPPAPTPPRQGIGSWGVDRSCGVSDFNYDASRFVYSSRYYLWTFLKGDGCYDANHCVGDNIVVYALDSGRGAYYYTKMAGYFTDKRGSLSRHLFIADRIPCDGACDDIFHYAAPEAKTYQQKGCFSLGTESFCAGDDVTAEIGGPRTIDTKIVAFRVDDPEYPDVLVYDLYGRLTTPWSFKKK